jgi:hypothetical protein
MDSAGYLLSTGPYLLDPESSFYAGNPTSPSPSALQSGPPLLDDNASQSLGNDPALYSCGSDGIHPTTWFSNFRESGQISSQRITQLISAEASPPIANPNPMKRKTLYDSTPHPPDKKQEPKRHKSFQGHNCGWQDCESAFDDVQKLR